MTDAVIIDAVRTPGGKRNGKLKDWHPTSLAAHVLKALEERNGLDPTIVDDVVMGCVMQVGEQSLNIGRNAVLAAGWPESVPATTVDRQCGSSQQAMHFAAQGVMAGMYDVVVAAGVEVMTRVPMGASVVKDMGFPFPPEQLDRYAETGLPPQGIGAEMIADEYGLTRRGPRRVRRPQSAACRHRVQGRPLRERDRAGACAHRGRDRGDDQRRGNSRGHHGRRRSPSSSRRSRRTARSRPATRRRSPTAPPPC